MSRICKQVIGIGPQIGSTQDADERICQPRIGVSPRIGRVGQVIYYDLAGYITYGDAGEIIY